jgi:hypothetical protein
LPTLITIYKLNQTQIRYEFLFQYILTESQPAVYITVSMVQCKGTVASSNSDLLLLWVSVVEVGQATVELGQAPVELAGALKAATVGVTACQNSPCPFLAGLNMGGGVYGGGGEEVHSRGERKRDWNIG